VVAAAYGDQTLTFGPEYLIPKPFDPRLITTLAPAVAKAAMDSGVATRPITDFDAYRQRLEQFVFRSGLVMKPVFERAKLDPRRLAFAEGEDERVLRAVQTVLDEGIAKPIVIGRREVVEKRLERLGLHIKIGKDFELCDPQDDPRFHSYWSQYHAIMERKGVSPDFARHIVRTRNTVIAALMVERGDADAMICGAVGEFHRHLHHVVDIVGLQPGVERPFALSVLILPTGTFFLADTFVALDPSAEEIAEIAVHAAATVQHFGFDPKVALLSHASFGSSSAPSAVKMRKALELIRERAPDLEVEGEMQADLAFSTEHRSRVFPNSRLSGQANLLIMPTLDAANIALNLLKSLGDGLAIGPALLGVRKPAHIVTPSTTVRGLVNMSAVAVYDAQVTIALAAAAEAAAAEA
jgi:malate dehydrogenase (oxaloacetate-decarboxylating)(NADP+)